MNNRSSWLALAPLAGLAALFVVAGYWLLWTTFMVYDDEGYVLWTLREFAAGGRLYDEIYTQYGPAFYLVHRVIGLLGMEFTNTSGRWLALAYWAGTAGFCAGCIWQQTRNAIATSVGFAAVFAHLWPMVNEPSHPGGLICLLLAITAWCGLKFIDGALRAGALVGVGCATLLLIKINVGAFACIGVAAWMALHAKHERFRRLAPWAVGLGLAFLPWLLMRTQSVEWTRVFAIVVGAAGLAATISTVAKPTIGIRGAAIVGGTALGTVSCILGISLLQGTSASGLLNGIVLGPLRHPSVYTLGFSWRSGTVAVAIVAVLAAATLRVWSNSRRTAAIGGLRIAISLVYLLCLAGVIRSHGYSFALNFGIVSAWVFMAPLTSGDRGHGGRTWLALLAITQALHAFPVAGSQVSWGTFLWVPLMVAGVHDAVSKVAFRSVRIGLAVAGLGLATSVGAQMSRIGWQRWHGCEPLGLPGAEDLRLPEELSSRLRVLNDNVAVHADVLFTYPGLHSFHIWSGTPPPTSANTTHWFNLLTADRQTAIRDRLAAAPRSSVLVQRFLLKYLEDQGISTASPLATWLRSNYTPAFRLGNYELWVRSGREIVPVNTAVLLETTQSDLPRFRVEATLASATPRTIGAIELRRLDPNANTSELVSGWPGAAVTFSVAPVHLSGELRFAPQATQFPFTAPPLARVVMLTNEFPADLPTAYAILYFRDAAGNKVGEARFID